MTLRRIFFWTLLFFTLFVVYESVLSPLLERLLWDRDTPFVASKKSINPQGLALPLLIYLTWRIFKWSDPGRLEEEIAEKKKAQEKKIGKNGYTNLMHLSGGGEIQEIQKQLILSSTVINAQDKGGYTALMYASSGGHLKVVELLLGLGADKKLMTKKGNNALFFAKNKNHTEIISILLSEFPASDGENSTQSNANHSGQSAQTSSMSTEEKIADFERRLNYKVMGLTEAQQEKLDIEFHNYARSRRLPD
jgi:hypothetical protein